MGKRPILGLCTRASDRISSLGCLSYLPCLLILLLFMASSSSAPPSQNTAQFTKLNDTNYLVWLRQLKPYLHGAKLWGYVDGSLPEPSRTTTTTASEGRPATTTPNPEHDKWFTTDQQIVSILTTSLTENVARLTIGFDTSKGIWDCLARHFSQRSVASSTSLKLQLFDLQKGSQSVDEYLQHAKSIADSLASINQPVSDADLVVATLHGLGPDYLMLRTALAQSSALPDFSDLRTRILAFDAQQTRSSASPLATALFHHGPAPDTQPPLPRASQPRRDGRRPQYGGRNAQRFRRGGARPPHAFQQHAAPQNANASFSPANWAARPTWSNGLLGPGPQCCSNCHTNQHGLTHCPHRFSGPTTATPFAGAHSLGDPSWNPDTGATHHMTAMPLHDSQPYGGPHNVYMGNDDSMPVSHSGPL